MAESVSIQYQRPPLYPLQHNAFFGEERYSITEASTKSGKTVGAMAWLLEQAIGGSQGQNFWWVAPVLNQAKIAYRRMKDGMPANFYSSNDSETYIRLKNGTTMWFKGSDNPDSLYGEDVRAAVIDEASRWREDAWFAVRTTLTATRGPIRIIGNVKGRKNWFFHLARRAESGERNMTYHRITAQDAIKAGVLDQDEISAAERDLPEEVFRELYYAEAADNVGNPFGVEAIEACVAPLSINQPAVWGWDLAKSHDFTVGVALDKRGAVCRFNRFQEPWGETQERMLQDTGNTPALVDATGVGDAVLEPLQRSGLHRFEGFKFSAPSKQELMFQLRGAIHRGDISFPDGPILTELESFEYEYTRQGVRYNAPSGMHDDCVMALALAWRQYQQKNISPESGLKGVLLPSLA